MRLFSLQKVTQKIRIKLYQAWPALLVYSALFLIVGFKFSFYLTNEQLTGWDMPGHWHMFQTYWSFFKHGHSLGYDMNWFQGFPAFYFYQPGYYFLLCQIYLVCNGFLSLTFVFNAGIFLIILLMAFSFFRLSAFLLRDLVDKYQAYLLALIGTLYYLSFPGTGLQGVSTVGVIQGTFVSTFGHSLALLAFYYLERHRRSQRYTDLFKFIILFSLLFYSHLLTTVFFTILLLIYIVFFFRDFKFKTWIWSAGLLFIFACPGIYLFLNYQYLNSASAIISYYPAFLSFLGKDWYDLLTTHSNADLKLLLDVLIIHLRLVNLLFIFLFIASLFLILKQKFQNQFVNFGLAVTIIFFMFSMDSTLSYLFPHLGIHWYRAFELFFIFSTLLVLFALGFWTNRFQNIPHRYLTSSLLLCLLIVQFLNWNPIKHEALLSIELTDHFRELPEMQPLSDYLKNLEPSSLILPEINHENYLAGSPHWLDYVIQQTGHRNALGLMIESSLTPLIFHAYLPEKLKQFFVWGIDITWKKELFQATLPTSEAYQTAFPRYLQRSGVQYFIALTPEMKSYLIQIPEYFTATFNLGHIQVFKVEKAKTFTSQLTQKPLGFLYLSVLQNSSINKKHLYQDFLLHANQVRLSGKLDTGIINLNPLYLKDRNTFMQVYKNLVAGLILFNDASVSTSTDLAADTSPHTVKNFATTDCPLLLVNFQTNPYLQEHIIYLNTFSSPIMEPDNTSSILMSKFMNANDNVGIPVKQVNHLYEQITFTTEPEYKELPVQLALSFFPDWHGAHQELIFQTDTNQMLVYSQGDKGELLFQQPLALFITCWLYLLVCLGLTCWMSGFTKKMKNLTIN